MLQTLLPKQLFAVSEAHNICHATMLARSLFADVDPTAARRVRSRYAGSQNEAVDAGAKDTDRFCHCRSHPRHSASHPRRTLRGRMCDRRQGRRSRHSDI